MSRTRQAGFTLIEVMVALAVMGLIASLAWGTMASSIEMRNYLELDQIVEREARATLARLERELNLAFLTENSSAVNTYKTVFIGKDEDDTDTLWFATKSHRRSYKGVHECDQTEITLWTDNDPKISSRQVLLHREAPRIDHEPDQDGVILPLATSVTRFDLTYLDPTTGEWLDEWDTTGIETPNRLPRAVQVVLQLMAPDPDDPDERSDDLERTYVRTIMVETATEQTRSLLSTGSGGGGGKAGGFSLQ